MASSSIDGADLVEAAPIRVWEPWRAEDRLRSIAAYVTHEGLVGLDEYRYECDSSDPSVVAEAIFSALASCEIRYGREPFVPADGGQQIRHPQWLLNGGTCLDFATTFASLSLDARIAPILVLGDRHAQVLLAPDRLGDAEDPIQTPLEITGCAEVEAGVLRVLDPAGLLEAVDRNELLVVDAVQAKRDGSDFSGARQAGRMRLESSVDLYLVDVCYLQDVAHPVVRQLRAPTGRPSITRYLKGGSGSLELLPPQAEAVREIEGQTGRVIALIAPSGQGKSTVGRRIVHKAPGGAGWFLGASDPQRLIDDLAETELTELGREEEGLAAVDRKVFANLALQRLRSADGPWRVVFDNADGDPNRIREYLPRPGRNQLVLITTTNPAWADVPGVEAVELSPVEDEVVESELGGDELVDLVAGRPLMLAAFKSLMSFTGLKAAAILDAPRQQGLADEFHAPAAYWGALASSGAIDDAGLRLAQLAAEMPPDRIPIGDLEELEPSQAGVASLAEAGLLAAIDGRSITQMHRLFGSVIRSEIEQEPGRASEIARQLLADEATRRSLERDADAKLLGDLADELDRLDGNGGAPHSTTGDALYGMAATLEFRGNVARSVGFFEKAVRHITGDDNESRMRRAECLHGQARRASRAQPPVEEDLRDALQMADEALEIARECNRGLEEGRYMAMKGILLKQLADFPRDGEDSAELLLESLSILERAHEIRSEHLVEDHPETVRSLFNLAGPRIKLARAQPWKAEDHLSHAERTYTVVGELRRRLFQVDFNDQIAACEHGLALTYYYRATLTRASFATRSKWLRVATDHCVEALSQRERVDGACDLGEAPKSAALLAKISRARAASPLSSLGAYRKDEVAMLKELEDGGLIVNGLSPLVADDTLRGQIDEWISSPALRVLLVEFGLETSGKGSVSERLKSLLSVADAWNFRGGVERNQVGRHDFSSVEMAVVARASEILGLKNRRRPPGGHYDHIVILGGLLRACLARPVYAARLLKTVDGSGARDEVPIAADSVIALGGHRALNNAELDLASRFLDHPVEDEFEGMDSAVRAAFSLAEPLTVDEVRPPIEHFAFSLREYVTADGMPVRVVAAPSSDPNRRANTVDGYTWLADSGLLLEGQRILLVTTDIYVPYQHADSIRVLGLEHGVDVVPAGLGSGEHVPGLAQPFQTHHYLQEIGSTIRSLHALDEALDVRTAR